MKRLSPDRVLYAGSTTTPPITEPGDYIFRWVGDDDIPKAHRVFVSRIVKRTEKRHGLPPIRRRLQLIAELGVGRLVREQIAAEDNDVTQLHRAIGA